jgi:hypothetical protein
MDFGFGRAPFALFFLISPVISDCPAGIQFYWGGVYQKDLGTAFQDSAYYNGSQTPEFRGSFVAKVTSEHVFELWSSTYSTSNQHIPSTQFQFDGMNGGTGERKWQWNASTLTKDFRYRLVLMTTDHYYWIKISISVEYSGHGMADLDGDLIGTCEVSGCRETALSRVPYSCQPSPSRSLSPSASASSAFFPSPLHGPSQVFDESSSFFISAQFDPSRVILEGRFPRTHVLIDSGTKLFRSAHFSGSRSFDLTTTAIADRDNSKKVSLSTGLIAGIGSVVFVAICVIVVLFLLKRKPPIKRSESDDKSTRLSALDITLTQTDDLFEESSLTFFHRPVSCISLADDNY